jgi:GcvH upstream region-like protein
MLSFFRHYQKVIFLFTTVLVVISFVFFGTYKAMSPGARETHDEVLYVAPKNRKITKGYLEKMQRFLELEPTFSYDPVKMLQSNPLNDGVITRDFLLQDVAPLLLSEENKTILEKKFAHEKSFSPYRHPSCTSVSSMAAWEIFAPELKEHLLKLKSCENVLSEQALAARSSLYLAHQRFNGDVLKQVLRYKEYQEGALADPLLPNKELSLFGYRTLSDWFGAPFVEISAKVIIQGSQMAKMRGLKVAKSEVHADMYERAQSTYHFLQQRTQIPVQSGPEFLKLLLSRLQMEEKDLLQIWEDVLYFRRLLDQESNAVVIDNLALKKFYEFAHHSLNVKVIEMPKELLLSNFESLKTFELYLDNVGERREDLLTLPSKYKSIEHLTIDAPELVGRRFCIEVAHLNKRDLASKVPLTTLWAWQESHYTELQELFALPAFSQFDSIDEKIRERVDQYSYSVLINEHPEWAAEVLATKVKETKELFICFKQERAALEGISDVSALSNLLNKEEVLAAYTQDGQNYYSIRVTDRGLLGEVLSYTEAKRIGALEELTKRKEGDLLVHKVLAAVRTSLERNGVALPKEGIERFCIERRFYNYLQKAKLDAHYREGFDVTYAPQVRYICVGRQDENFAEVSSKGSYLFWDATKGLSFYEVEPHSSQTTVPLERLYVLQQLASKDIKQKLIKEIAASL